MITVITVVFNSKEALAKTMRSVRVQDYKDLEYIVVDGGSTDGTVDVIKANQPTITHWISEKDNGIYDAMNKGVRLAQGDYCIFMNAGDAFVNPQVVSDVVKLTDNADVVYGDIVKNGQIIAAKGPRNCHKMFYCHQAAFVKTGCLKEFPFDTSHKMSADFKQAKQLILAGKRFRHVDLVVADYDTSGISNTQRSKGLEDNIKVIWEVDTWAEQCRLLPRLFFTYLLCKLRGR